MSEIFDSVFTLLSHLNCGDDSELRFAADEFSDSLNRKLLEAKVRGALFCLYSANWEEVEDEMGQLLTFGSIGDSFYDIVIEIQYLIEQRKTLISVQSIVKLLTSFCSKFKEQEYLRFFRNLIISSRIHDINLLSCINLLIVECYGRGMLSCGWDKRRISVLSDYDISLLELIILSISELSIEDISFLRDKDFKTVRTIIQLLNQNAKELFKTVHTYSNLDSLVYLIVDGSNQAVWNTFAPTMLNCNSCKFLIHNADGSFKEIISALKPDFLQHRKIFVREQGISLVFKGDAIKRISLWEVHRDDCHVLVIKYEADTVESMFVVDLVDCTRLTQWTINTKNCLVFLCVLHWLGLTNEFVHCCPYRELEGVSSGLVFAHLYLKDDNMHYETPKWWNYSYSSSRSKTKSSEANLYKIVEVGMYSRRLPNGQQASQEAVALAKRYCMILEPGYTLVQGFQRKQPVKV